MEPTAELDDVGAAADELEPDGAVTVAVDVTVSATVAVVVTVVGDGVPTGPPVRVCRMVKVTDWDCWMAP